MNHLRSIRRAAALLAAALAPLLVQAQMTSLQIPRTTSPPALPGPAVRQVAVQIAAGVDHLGQAVDRIASAAEQMQQQHANERAALEAQQTQLSSDYAAKKEQLRQKQLQEDATLRAAQLKLLDPCNQELQRILSSIDHVMQMEGGDPANFLAHSVYDVRALLKYLQQVQAQVTGFSSVS